MKKIICSVVLCVVSICPVFSLDVLQDIIILTSLNEPENCNDNSLSDIVPSFYDDTLYNFELELKKEFDFSWTEENFSPESRVMLSKTLSPLLSNILPCTKVIFSRPLELEDGLISFRFKDLDRNEVYSVICKDGKIVSLTLV